MSEHKDSSGPVIPTPGPRTRLTGSTPGLSSFEEDSCVVIDDTKKPVEHTPGELQPVFPTTPEQAEVLGHFMLMLKAATGDGGKKRAAGLKPSWKVDPSHEAAMFSHINKWKHGEKVDKDSGVHPLVHLAWRALAIAFQESNAPKEPEIVRTYKSIAEAVGGPDRPQLRRSGL